MTTRPSARRLRRWGFAQAVALDTWQTHELVKDGARLRITAAPGRHAPGLAQAGAARRSWAACWSSCRRRAGEPPLTVYVTGDTLMVDALREVPRRHPAPRPRHRATWAARKVLGLTVTMDGPQGADLLELVRPARTVPVHHDDYGVFRSPLSDFLAEVQRRGLTGVRPVARGETVPLPLP